MVKLYTHTEEIEHCGECPEILDWFDTGKKDWRCEKGKRRRIVKDIHGGIPKWCELPEKEKK